MARFGRVQEVLMLLLNVWPVLVLAGVRHPLPVLWMMPVNSGTGMENLTVGVVPAIRMALQDLERQAAPLGNYEVRLQLLDSQCDPAKALKALFDTLWVGPRYLLMLGGVCPPVTALIARSLPALSLLQVSFVAPPPDLSNRKWHRHLFSTVPSVRAANMAVVKLLQRYRWRRIGVFTQDRPGLTEMRKDLTRQLMKTDIQLTASESFSEDPCSSLKKLKDEDVRIIIGQFEDGSVTEVFCCAYRLNLFGPRYQWILAAEGPSGWRLGWQPSGCSVTSLLMAAEGSFRVQIKQFSSTNTPGVSGRTSQNYLESYLKQVIQEGSEVSPLHAFVYDAVWVAARALVQVTEAVKLRGKYGSLRNVTVSEEEEVKMLLEAVKNTQFEGVTGPVSFRNGERTAVVELIQFQGDSGVLVGEFNTSNQQVRLMTQLLKFKGPGPAKDQTLVHLQHRQVSLILYTLISSVATGTIFITLIILCIVIICHRRWPLRSGSSSQDELLLLGLLLSSSSVLFSGLNRTSLPDRTLEVLCSVRLWTLSVGHTAGFAALFTRTWRVYCLCSIKKKHRTRLQETGCVPLWILLLDVFVLTFWQILDPLRWVVLQHSLEEYLDDQDILIRSYSEQCRSTNMDLWLTAVYGYKAPLLGLGCFLAWNIRTADLGPPALSCALLALSMFSMTVFSMSGVSGSLLTSSDPSVQFCLCSVLILSCNLLILIGLFGPQICCMLCSSTKFQQASEMQDEAAEEEGVERLRRLNQDLRSQSAQLDVQVETITMELSEMLQDETGAGVTSLTLTHEALVCEEKSSGLENINSPDHVQRRLSMQLPILHHSYLPVIGGVSSSSSSLFVSQEAFAYRHHDHFLHT
ncbi:gamma-aminobutyric acid type B receptor subunit 2-like isoform X2 [Girardinichthys multiradiatus]|uniref:gamma-aminobutyric acid type B receptor subunit 2-like isoform X2 n=1 Tax=Girardinichthys multiradiatus TaxID=208333 RepID=UPI001FAD47C0|nr:gamma-aminobutyric acid type B receptor subunit 2-like isoform X2 [Girardinichthys multiradiatus]